MENPKIQRPDPKLGPFFTLNILLDTLNFELYTLRCWNAFTLNFKLWTFNFEFFHFELLERFYFELLTLYFELYTLACWNRPLVYVDLV
jgi:hypothetical protein